MSRYLEQLHIDLYGALSDFDLGPFDAGLNIVYGPNEAGKSTIASFLGGVLFGWEEARGVRNTYRPEEGHRAGALTFAEREQATPDAAPPRSTLARAHNADGLKGDTTLVGDIDSATFRTMFSLTSDELRSLRNTSDVTARLLTAGSGTGSSPAAAFVEVEQRIAERLSASPDAADSVVVLGRQLEEKREEVAAAADVVRLRKQEARERGALVQSRAEAAARLDEMADELAGLHAARARLEAADAQLADRKADLESLRAERMELLAGASDVETGEPLGAFSPQLQQLDSASERTIRDMLDELAEEQAKAARGLDIAKENSAASTAAYEALLEIDEDAANSPGLRNRSLQAVVSVLLPVAFIAAGLAVFFHGRSIGSLSFTALGAGLVVSAFFLAAVALIVLVRPNRDAEALDNRRQDAQWVMLQDKKKLDASQRASDELERRVGEYLAGAGLAAANGSIRQARTLLDDAREARSRAASLNQRTASLEMRERIAAEAIADLEAERATAAGTAGLDADCLLHDVDALIRRKSDERDALSRAHDDMNQRFGELDQRLAQAEVDHELDRRKAEYQRIICRLRESKHELVTLLLARRMLEKSIVAWESRSQPEVYNEASRLFSTITDGAWQRISMTAEGRLVATASDGRMLEVRHLSLGTCQQLYLSLRVAMLLHAESVGRAIPVIADDILVHFDAGRRGAAARVLAELARKRQVIVFTCHEETVVALRAADAGANYLEL